MTINYHAIFGRFGPGTWWSPDLIWPDLGVTIWDSLATGRTVTHAGAGTP
jgi:hypothetical protein